MRRNVLKEKKKGKKNREVSFPFILWEPDPRYKHDE